MLRRVPCPELYFPLRPQKKCSSFPAWELCVVTKPVTLGSCPEPELVPNALTLAAVCPRLCAFGLFLLGCLRGTCVGGCTVAERHIQPLIGRVETPKERDARNLSERYLRKRKSRRVVGMYRLRPIASQGCESRKLWFSGARASRCSVRGADRQEGTEGGRLNLAGFFPRAISLPNNDGSNKSWKKKAQRKRAAWWIGMNCKKIMAKNITLIQKYIYKAFLQTS